MILSIVPWLSISHNLPYYETKYDLIQFKQLRIEIGEWMVLVIATNQA